MHVLFSLHPCQISMFYYDDCGFKVATSLADIQVLSRAFAALKSLQLGSRVCVSMSLKTFGI